MSKEQEFAVRQAWKALLFAATGAIKNIHVQLDRLETELQIEGHIAHKALSCDIATAVKSIRDQVEHLETRLGSEDIQVQRTIEKEAQEAFLVSTGSGRRVELTS